MTDTFELKAPMHDAKHLVLIPYVSHEMKSHQYFPSVEKMIEQEPSELASDLLSFLMSNHDGYNIEPVGLMTGISNELTPVRGFEVRQALLEAFNWLESNGLVGYDPSISTVTTPWKAVTRAGRRVYTDNSIEVFKRQQLLRKELIHPSIFDRVANDFFRGDYDSAILKAFAEIEHQVRDLTGLSNSIIGTDLMRRAFATDNGPLTDLTEERAERDALAHLYAGAIGLGKNSAQSSPSWSNRCVGSGSTTRIRKLSAVYGGVESGDASCAFSLIVTWRNKFHRLASYFSQANIRKCSDRGSEIQFAKLLKDS